MFAVNKKERKKDCFAHNKGFIRPNSYSVRPELLVGEVGGSRHVAGFWYRRVEIFTVLGVELSGPILFELSRTKRK